MNRTHTGIRVPWTTFWISGTHLSSAGFQPRSYSSALSAAFLARHVFMFLLEVP